MHTKLNAPYFRTLCVGGTHRFPMSDKVNVEALRIGDVDFQVILPVDSTGHQHLLRQVVLVLPCKLTEGHLIIL